MATARDTIKRALRLIGAISSGDEPAAEEAQDALDALNGMMAAFKSLGIDYDHIPLALTDVFPMPEAHRDHVAQMLAVRIAPEYGATPAPIVMGAAASALLALQAAYFVADYSETDPAILERNYVPGPLF